MDPRLAPFWILAVAFAVMLTRNWRRLLRPSPTMAVVCAAAVMLLPLAVMAKRNVGPFLMIAIPALTMLLPRRESAGENRVGQPAINFAIMSAAIVIVAATIAFAYYHRVARLRWQPGRAAGAGGARELSRQSLQPLRRGRQDSLVRP